MGRDCFVKGMENDGWKIECGTEDGNFVRSTGLFSWLDEMHTPIQIKRNLSVVFELFSTETHAYRRKN